MKVQIERFHLNGHTIGFRPQTQKLKLPYKTPLITLAVKGLNRSHSVPSNNQIPRNLRYLNLGKKTVSCLM